MDCAATHTPTQTRPRQAGPSRPSGGPCGYTTVCFPPGRSLARAGKATISLGENLFARAKRHEHGRSSTCYVMQADGPPDGCPLQACLASSGITRETGGSRCFGWRGAFLPPKCQRCWRPSIHAARHGHCAESARRLGLSATSGGRVRSPTQMPATARHAVAKRQPIAPAPTLPPTARRPLSSGPSPPRATGRARHAPHSPDRSPASTNGR